PEYRRRGVGTRLLEWSLERAPRGVELSIANEALTADAHALYLSNGFRPRMTETRMVRPLVPDPPDARLPAGVATVPWTADSAPLFFTAYRASFADRPGFPDPGAEEWIADGRGAAFRPDLSRVALLGDEPLGFITIELRAGSGWIDQLGIAPEWRGRGLARALLNASLRRLYEEHLAEVFLHVNLNNPRAARLFSRAGFRADLQRARYTKDPDS
ncbi:MAG TPA: GNAT family N-acetyltransferase, partial [Solirubrobacteraceae bacterium]|nr:GNAT family N-acetyltransferase [Solirubrobacteraceae bacterium]